MAFVLGSASDEALVDFHLDTNKIVLNEKHKEFLQNKAGTTVKSRSSRSN